MTSPQAPIKSLTEDEELYVDAEQKLFELYKHRSTNIAQAQVLEREKRMATLTLVELDKLPSETITYKAVGRSFITKKQDLLKGDIRNNIDYCDTELKKLQETRMSIQKRIETEEDSFKNIITKIQLSKQQAKSQ